MSEINLIQGEATVINVTEASEPTVIQMGVLEVVKIDDDFLAYIAQAEAARDVSQAAMTSSQTAQGLSEAARDTSVAAKDISVTARDGAVLAQGHAEAAQGLAEGARDASIFWAGKAEEWAETVGGEAVSVHDVNPDAHANLTPRAPAAHDHDTSYEPLLGVPGGDDYLLASKTDGTRAWIPAPDSGNVVISPTEPAAEDHDKIWFDGTNFYIYEATP